MAAPLRLILIAALALAGAAQAQTRPARAGDRAEASNLQPTPAPPTVTPPIPAPCLRYEAAVRACAEGVDANSRRQVNRSLDQQTATWRLIENQAALAAACQTILERFEAARPSMGC